MLRAKRGENQPLLYPPKSSVSHITILYVWLILVSLGLILGLTLYATVHVNPKLSSLRTDVNMAKMVAMNTEAMLDAFLTNSTQSETVRSGTFQVANFGSPLGTTTYRLERIMLGELPITWIEVDPFSFPVSGAVEITLQNPTPTLADVIVIPDTALAFPLLSTQQEKIQAVGCANTVFDSTIFVIRNDAIIVLFNGVCSGPYTIQTTQPLRILLPQF